MAHTDGTMMRRAVAVPVFNKFARAHGKSIPAVGVADLKYGPCNGFGFRDEKY
jgi:hypothetical protein